MNRITPEEVVAAYAATGIKPVRGMFCETIPNGCKLCALSVVAVARGAVSWRDLEAEDDDTELERMVREALNLAHGYFCGFVDGFDDNSEPLEDSVMWQGYRDGRACAAAVFGDCTPAPDQAQ